MKRKILVTGATGNVGQEVLRFLVEKYSDQTVLYTAVTNVERAQAALPYSGLTFVPFSFEDPATVRAAFSQVDSVFLLRPPQLSDVDKYFKPVIAIAAQTQVKHLVFLSLQGVENNSVTPHYKIEKLIVASGIPYTFLRPSFFMQNLTTTHLKEIAERSEIFIPAGKGKTNFVDARDLGEVGARVLAEGENHYNQAYELTGDHAYDYDEIAQIISRATGKTVVYKNPSVIAFVWRKWLKEGMPLSFVLVMVALYTVSKLGKAAGYSPGLRQLLGRSPISFATFAQDFKHLWM
jgi:uncharacterized protein YbjT (DUF2867 family)